MVERSSQIGGMKAGMTQTTNANVRTAKCPKLEINVSRLILHPINSQTVVILICFLKSLEVTGYMLWN